MTVPRSRLAQEATGSVSAFPTEADYNRRRNRYRAPGDIVTLENRKRLSAAPVATALGLMLGSVPLTSAHHSFVPHFDPDTPVVLDGTVVRFEARNPHAYLHIEVIGDDGDPQVWVCESHGVTMLERHGVTRGVLVPGTRLVVSGAAARRDPRGCFFRTVELADGRVLSADGPAAARAAASTPSSPAAEPETVAAGTIFGAWLLRPRAGGGGGQQDPMIEHLTEAGRHASAAYDPYTDDPVLRCDPIGVRRVWFAVGTPLQISRDGERVRLRAEWMDAERIIHLDVDEFPQTLQAGTLGYSIGRFEDDTLVVDTRYARGGIVSQYVLRADGAQIGLLHSDQMTTREQVRVDPETGLLNVTIETHDPVYYTRPFPPVTATYAPSELALQPFGCTPEVDH